MELQDLKDRLRKSLQVIQKLQTQLDANRVSQATAIIGVSCTLPGGIRNMDDLWDFLYKGGNGITPFPQERLSTLGYTGQDAEGIKGGFIHNIDQFDPTFFNIGQQEAASMDPQHRILLELVWRAFEDANLDIHSFKGKRVGVFIALSNNDYSLQRLRNGGKEANPYDFTGNILAPAAGRISYTFDFRGPCSVIDTACSSSLVAFHQAHTALNNNECDLAIVGGINLVLDLQMNKALMSIEALAPDGYCKPLDESANGYTRSEGGAVFILKKEDVLEQGKDKPYGLIKGSFLNHDGHSNGFTAPNGQAQEAVLNGALKAAGLSSNDIDYIELHGTGTALGDPIEIDAIQNVFLEEERERPLYIGSIKSNMGHLECAAGLAGMLKTVVVLKHRTVPPTIHIRKLNPLIEWQEGVKVPLLPKKLAVTPDGKIRAGISSFGISGTNAHIIVESIPEVVYSGTDIQDTFPLLISAASPKALQELVKDYIEFFERANYTWKDICTVAATGRAHWPFRLSIMATSAREAIAKLKAVLIFDKEINRRTANESLEATIASKVNGITPAGIVANLYEEGYDYDWAEFFGTCSARLILPGHPFLRKECWVNKVIAVNAQATFGTACQHAVFSQYFSLPGDEDIISFTGELSLEKLPWLDGHRLFDTVLYPGAGFLEWALFAAKELKIPNAAAKQLSLKEPLALKPGETFTIWLKVTRNGDGYDCHTYSKHNDAWTLHSQCILTTASINNVVNEFSEKGQPLDIAAFYKQCKRAGIGYTGAFARLGKAWKGGKILTGIVSWQQPAKGEQFMIHPALLDNCFQVLGAYVMSSSSEHAYVPYKIETAISSGNITDGDVEVIIVLPEHMPTDFASLRVDIAVKQDGELKMILDGFHLVKVDRQQFAKFAGNPLEQHIYVEEWIEENIATSDVSIFKSTNLETSLADIDTQLATRSANTLHELDKLANDWVAVVFGQLGCDKLEGSHSFNELIAKLHIKAEHSRLFKCLLSAGIAKGYIIKDAEQYKFNAIPIVDINEAIGNTAKASPTAGAELAVLNRCAGNIAAILMGNANPVDVLFPSGSIEYVKALYAADAFQVMHQLTASSFKKWLEVNKSNAPLKVLEIGAGTGSTTKHILPLLQGRNVSYDFTDISPLFLHEAKEALPEYGFVNYKTLDIEKDFLTQGFDIGSYDLIIASNVLHATSDLKTTFSKVHSLLKTNGHLFMVEGTTTMLWIDLIFGITSGWWLFSDTTLRPEHALLSVATWKSFLSDSSFDQVQVLSPLSEGRTASGQSVIWATKKAGEHTKPVIILDDTSDIPAYASGMDVISIQDYTVAIEKDTVIIIPITNRYDHLPANEALTQSSLALFNALSFLKTKDIHPGRILLLSTGNNKKTFTGLWRSLQNECKDWDIGLLISQDINDLQQCLATELTNGKPGECSYFLNSKRYVLRLNHAKATQKEPIEWTGKNILITGGAGGLGIQLSDWLLDKGVAKIYITGRKAAAPTTDVRINYIQQDIAQELGTIKDKIDMIFHLAGVVADRPFWKQDEASMSTVLDAKVKGAEHVLEYAKQQGVANVLFFSSSACMLGTIGQTNHALANAWLQHTATDTTGITIQSIAWGIWKGAGAATDHDVDTWVARMGIEYIIPAEGFDAMEQVIALGIKASGIFNIDWDTYAESMKATPYITAVIGESQHDTDSADDTAFEDIIRLEGASQDAAIIAFLRKMVSSVLGHKEMQLFDANAGFFEIGLDSLTALDLKTRLQQATKMDMPATLIFKYPNIRSLAHYLTDNYKQVQTEEIVITEQVWDSTIDAQKFIEQEFNSLFDNGATIN